MAPHKDLSVPEASKLEQRNLPKTAVNLKPQETEVPIILQVLKQRMLPRRLALGEALEELLPLRKLLLEKPLLKR